MRDNGSPEAAARFLAAAERTFALLASMPEMGKPWRATFSGEEGLRVFPVRGFKSHLVFYRPLAKPRGIEVLHVFHAARDLHALLKEKARSRPGPQRSSRPRLPRPTWQRSIRDSRSRRGAGRRQVTAGIIVADHPTGDEVTPDRAAGILRAVNPKRMIQRYPLAAS
jgi:toxin ParE1/3/4